MSVLASIEPTPQEAGDPDTGVRDGTGGHSPGRDAGATAAPHPWWHPLAPVDRALDTWHDLEKRLFRQPLARLSLVGPRTARFTAQELVGGRLNGVPRPRLTPGLISQVIMDEAIMALVVGPGRFPRRADYERVSAELADALAAFIDKGWIDDPASFHQTPPPLESPALANGWALGQSYERILWPSGYEPRPEVPGGERWMAFEANRTASAWLLRHRDRPRPWAVCIHGFGTGSTFMDLFSFRAAHLHADLELNVASLVLPVHGPRRPSRLSGEEFLGFEFMNSVHGLTQSLWDVRRLISWIRTQDPTGIGVFGVSLGGMITSLLACFEPDLDLVLAGIPVVDFPALIEHHAPTNLALRSVEHHILDGTAQQVHRVVSPLAMDPVVPHGARAIFAGLGDRLVTPDQAQRLWTHWDCPEIRWFAGNHVGYLWSDTVWRFVAEAFGERDLVDADDPVLAVERMGRRRISR